VHPLRCHSGGAIELFIEPFSPPLTVTIVGDTPVARTLAALCEAAGFDTTAAADPEEVPVAGFVVVATMGRADELSARAALLAGAPYVAVVASRRRAQALREWLTANDVPAEALEALHAPAGLDLGARGADGVAVSILAEIIAERDRLTPRITPTEPAASSARDPVCGMAADPASSPTAEHGGETYAFCSVHCREAFLSDPDRFLSS
jgi:xanthine dehydrogenase accessory factor